jgi:hypothetical protein
LFKKKRGVTVTVAIAIGVIAMCAISGVVGGALSRNFGSSNYTISYADFIAVMLTAVSVLLVALTIFLAVLGLLGWAAISNGVQTKTEAFLTDGFKEGNPLHKLVESRVAAFVYEGVDQIPDVDDPANNKGGQQ